MTLTSEFCNEIISINNSVKLNVGVKINCPKCNKPDMSKKNISTHYKKGCSGIFNQYELTKQKKEKSPKESKVRQSKQPKESKQVKEIKTRKPRLKKLSLQESYDFMVWLFEQKLFIHNEFQSYKEYYEDYLMSKEPIKLIINLPQIIKKVEIKKEEINKEEIRNEETKKEEIEKVEIEKVRIEEVRIEEVGIKEIEVEEEQVGIEYCISCNGELRDEHYDGECNLCHAKQLNIEPIISQDNEEEDDEDDEMDEETKVYLNKRYEEEREYELKNKLKEEKEETIVQEATLTDEQIEWQEYLKCQEEVFFQEDDQVENEYWKKDTEEHIEYRLNKFIERFSDKEIKSYSNDKKKKLVSDMIKQKQQLWGLFQCETIDFYYIKNKGYNFIIRNLIDLIKLKIDKIIDNLDEETTEEEDIKLINKFDKNKILENFKDKFNHWCDRATSTYQYPKGYEITITSVK